MTNSGAVCSYWGSIAKAPDDNTYGLAKSKLFPHLFVSIYALSDKIKRKYEPHNLPKKIFHFRPTPFGNDNSSM